MSNNPLEELELYASRHYITPAEVYKLTKLQREAVILARRLNGQRIDHKAFLEAIAIVALPHNGPRKRMKVLPKKSHRNTPEMLSELIGKIRNKQGK